MEGLHKQDMTISLYGGPRDGGTYEADPNADRITFHTRTIFDNKNRYESHVYQRDNLQPLVFFHYHVHISDKPPIESRGDPYETDFS